MSKKLISIVIPAFREEKNISLITNELQEILETIKINMIMKSSMLMMEVLIILGKK